MTNRACTNWTGNLYSEGAPENEQNSRANGGKRFGRVFASGVGWTSDTFWLESLARRLVDDKSCLHGLDGQSVF